MEFFGYLTPDFDYIKKIISWIGMSYLFYKAGLTNIFFGKRSRTVEIILIIAFSILSLKSFVAVSLVSIEEMECAVDGGIAICEGMPFNFYNVYYFFAKNAIAITEYSTILGSLILFITSIILGFKMQVKSPSVLAILHDIGRNKNFFYGLKRGIKTFFAFMIFYVIIFNIIFEWLALILDSQIMLISILIVITLFLLHKRSGKSVTIVYKVFEACEEFYEHVIKQLKYKHTLLLGISGMLTLHLFSDLLVFIFPFLFQNEPSIYLANLDIHTSLLEMVRNQIIPIFTENALEGLMYSLIYVLNIIGIVSILILPVWLWYLIYQKKLMHVYTIQIGLILVTLPSIIFSPLFKIKMISLVDSSLAGVKIIANEINPLISPALIVLVSFILSLIVLLFSHIDKIKKLFTLVCVIVSQIFLLIYSSFYFLEFFKIYTSIITQTLKNAMIVDIFILIIIFIIGLITLLFYSIGFLIFEIELSRELKKYLEF